jgi:carboxylesterase
MTQSHPPIRKRMALPLSVLCALFVFLTACGEPVFEYEDWWMDSPLTQDPSLSDRNALVSTHTDLKDIDRATPVIIAAHGFTASTYEWEEFRDFATADTRVLISLVLLGGHGRSTDAFRFSTWEDWGKPILDEYKALVAAGFTNISLVGSSTGGALMLEQLSRGAYAGKVTPRHFFFIDAIVVPGNKLLTLVNPLSLVIDNMASDGTEEEKKHWYTNRPSETLRQLNTLTNKVKAGLADGMKLPAGTQARIYKTNGDQSADPVSALLMYRGLTKANGETVDVTMYDSNLHVFTRLKGREADSYTAADVKRQQDVFREMIEAAAQN